MYNYFFSKTVIKFLEKQDIKFNQKIQEKIEILCANPFDNSLDIKTFKWHKNHYRLRIWKYRFLYEIIQEKVFIYFYDADSR